MVSVSRGALAALLAPLVAGCGSSGPEAAIPATPQPSAHLAIDEVRTSYRGVAAGATKDEARRRFGRVRVGDPLAPIGSVPLAIGIPPTPRYPPGRSAVEIWRFRHVAIAADRKGAWLLTVAQKHARTARGVRVGSPLRRVREAYPSLRCGTANEGTEYVSFAYCTGRVAPGHYIWFGGDPVRSITVSVAPLN
jgi:hypothetical protein